VGKLLVKSTGVKTNDELVELIIEKEKDLTDFRRVLFLKRFRFGVLLILKNLKYGKRFEYKWSRRRLE
jgi:hypothetical protein